MASPTSGSTLRLSGSKPARFAEVGLALFKAMRPHQWIKNGLLYAGIIFSLNFFNLGLFLKVTAAFFTFCLLTGGLYIINDLFDLEKDKKHPTKCKRPLASGRLPVAVALPGAVTFLMLSFAFSFFLEFRFGLLCVTYFLLNFAYCLYLKHLVIVDVFVLAIDFVIRAVAGACVINVSVSHWLILCTFLLSLFIGFGKRRQEIILLKEKAKDHRKSLQDYSAYFLDQMMAIVTGATIMSYALYTLSEETVSKFGTDSLVMTVPFVLYGIFRYLYLVYQKNEGGSPTKTLLKDVPLQINIFLWLLTSISILYWPSIPKLFSAL